MLTSTIVLVLAAGSTFAYDKFRSDRIADRSFVNTSESTTKQEGRINLDPPTITDIQRAEQNKQDLVNRQDQEVNRKSQFTSTKKIVIPTITYAGQYNTVIEVGGYVDGVFESEANCTATFTKDTLIFTKSVIAVQNINSMDCPVMQAAASEFSSKGSWSITVSYNSSTAAGSSDTRSIEVK